MARIIALTAALISTLSTAAAAEAVRTPFGRMPDGTAVEMVELVNQHGMRARVITLGAALQSLTAPDRAGRSEDVVLGPADLESYINAPNYFGVIVGRYANRIAGGAFSLDGRRYALATNNGANALHGGVRGFDKVVWRITQVRSGPAASVTLAYTSPDGEEGYPGALRVSVTYALNEGNELSISYRATTDRPTVLNLTNHSFFNLAGAASGRSILGHRLTIAADAFTPVDETLIPTGEIRDVAGTPFDFRQPTEIGARIHDAGDEQIVYGRGYDHNWVLSGAAGAAPRLAARLEDPGSGRVLEILTTEPGLQFYSGNFLNGAQVGKGAVAYRQGDGLCLEPQHFPDSPNQPAFPSARLDPGQTYRQSSIYRFSVAPTD
jgi:aldose 1-epimerase